MKKIIIYLIAAIALTSCDLDFFPSDAMTPEQLSKDPGGAVYITDGNYSMFKDEYEYKGFYASGNSYIRHFMQMAEFPSDNICLSGRTTDVLYEATVYGTNSTLKNVTTLWWLSYRIIYGTNSVIEAVVDGASVDSDHLKGENYFLRAIAHLNLVTLYAKPYSHGRDNPGVVLRTSTNTEETTRATVGQVYDQIESDLKNAIRLMDKGTRRGDAGYASKEAAQGLLSRVYLYMEKNDEVIKLVNEMLGGATPSSKLESKEGLAGMFANSLNSRETLWAVTHTAIETRGQSSIASMYLNDGVGWGEVFSSDPLNDLYEKYPNDVRYNFVKPIYKKESTKHMITYPVENANDNSRSNEVEIVTQDNTGAYTFVKDGVTIKVQSETVNGYEQKFIMLKGVKHKVRFTREMENRNSFPKYFVTKFSYQNGDPMLNSPVMLRWAEVILNRAEAYAKTSGKESDALNDVNELRKRAGLSGNELFTTANMNSRGYSSVLDVVLDERRLELAFEGHRMFDLYRNKRNMDRKYAGVQPWEVVSYNDNKIQYPIPFDETTVSGIQ